MSTAERIAERQEVVVSEDEVLGNITDTGEEDLFAETTPVEETVEPEVEIPSKFQGKSLEDVITSYQNLEKEKGRMANDLGELRKLSDQLIQSQLDANKQETVKEETPSLGVDELLDDPNSAVDRLVANHPKLKALEDKIAKTEVAESHKAFEGKHPDYKTIGADERFQQWVLGSEARVRLFQQADAGDFAMADELLTTFKALHPQEEVDAKKEQQVAKRQKQMKAGTLEKGTTGAAPKKVYRRADLMRLMNTDPTRYNAMQDEIVKAYAEGRVR